MPKWRLKLQTHLIGRGPWELSQLRQINIQLVWVHNLEELVNERHSLPPHQKIFFPSNALWLLPGR